MARHPSQTSAAIDLSEAALWAAACSRDTRYDGLCYLGVVTTGIYCRLQCPARMPLRKNVRFFFSREGAEKAGLRPCKRCRPETVGDSPINGPAAKIIAACRHIESADTLPTLRKLAARAGCSPFHLQRLFKNALGVSPRAYADAIRQTRFRRAVGAGERIISAAYGAGYGSSSRLYEKSHDFLGMTPQDYKNKGRKQDIMYAIVKCPLGWILVAATRKGLCVIRIGDTRRTLVEDLKQEFGAAQLQKAGAPLTEWTQKLIDWLAGESPWPKLPYDVRATAFQRKVWEALRNIPEGETLSYSDVATAIGRPTAVRAVARACAENRVALVVPCHRVIGKSGALTGYRWGVDRKQKLLTLEQQKKSQ